MECCIEILGLGTGMAEADVEDADDDECVEGESCGRKQIYEIIFLFIRCDQVVNSSLTKILQIFDLWRRRGVVQRD